jgi:hypothetical protein
MDALNLNRASDQAADIDTDRKHFGQVVEPPLSGTAILRLIPNA